MSIQSEIDRIISVKNDLRAALKAKGATLTDGSVLADFVDAVNGLQIGGGSVELPTVSVTADKLLNGETAIDSNGNVVTGTIATVALSRSEDVVSIGKGYTTGGSVTIPSAVIFSNRIDIESGSTTSTSAKIRVNIGVDEEQGGYVPNDWVLEKNITIAAAPAKEWTPGTSNQTLSKNRWLNGDQVIKGDSNLKAANIKSGVSIFGVTGTYEATVTTPDETTAVLVYNFLGAVSGDQDSNVATAAVSIAVEEAGWVDGSLNLEWAENIAALPYTEYTPTTTDIHISSDCWLNGTQVIKGDSNLKAENIKSGVKIFGVTGSFEGSATGGSANISFGVVDENGKFQPLDGTDTPPTAVGNPITGEFYTFDTDRDAPSTGGGGGGSFAKVTEFVAPYDAYSAVSSVQVSGFGLAETWDGETDFSDWNGTYGVTPDTVPETDINKKVFKYSNQDKYLYRIYDDEYGDVWVFATSTGAQYVGNATFYSRNLQSGTWYNYNYDVNMSLTINLVTTNYPAQPLVLEAVAASYANGAWNFGSAVALTEYDVEPMKTGIYMYSGSKLIGNALDYDYQKWMPTNGLLSYFPMNENDKKVADVISGNKLISKGSGVCSGVDGWYGNGDAGMIYGSMPYICPKQFTLALKFNMSDCISGEYIPLFEIDGGIGLFIRGSYNSIRGRMNNSWMGNGDVEIERNVDITAFFICDGNSVRTLAMKDGETIGEHETDDFEVPEDNFFPIYILGYAWDSTMTGKVWDIMLYNRVLTDDEIATIATH